MLDHPSSVLIVGELPVTGSVGKGSIDLVVFIRRNIKGLVMWTPVVIIEIKTKTSFDFNLFAVQTGKKKELPPTLYGWKRVLTKEEWERTIESKPNPDDRVLNQLLVYERALLEESKELIPASVRFPEKLWKGVIVLDTDQDYSEVFKAFHFLLKELTTEILTGTLGKNDSRALVLESKDENVVTPRVALMFLEDKKLDDILKEQSVVLSLPVEDPFKERISDERLLTQYISIPSSTSFGNAAAWTSRNWHLLNHIEEVSQLSKTKPQVYWIDLLGDYPTDQLKKRRFGLDTLLKRKQITRHRHCTLTTLLDSITFLNLKNTIDSFLCGKDIDLSRVMEQIPNEEAPDSERIIIVDGWPQLREMIPRRKLESMKSIENQFLEILPTQSVNVIWIDDCVSHTRMNKHYQRTCIRPLRHDSPRRFHIDEIIYNVPTAPRVFGWQTPRKEDTRFIIQDTPARAHPWIQSISVPYLKGWARKYRGLSRRDGVVTERDVYESDFEGEPMHNRSVTLGNVYTSLAPLTSETVKQLQRVGTTLIPSLQRHDPSAVEDAHTSEVQWLRGSLAITRNDAPSFTERLTYAPDKPPPQPPRNEKRYVEFSKIKRGWYYDRTPIDPNDQEYEVGVSRRPPMYLRTGLDEVDSLSVRKREIKRLMSAAKFLMKQLHKDSRLYSCCSDIVRLCADAPLESEEETALLIALQGVRDVILRDSWRLQIWDQVGGSRATLGDVLSSDNRAVLKMARELCPEIISLYGNNLFLAFLTVIKKHSLKSSDSLVTALWETMAEWQLYQMGFRSMSRGEEIAQSQYDFQFIYSRLMRRVESLKDAIHTQVPIEEVIYGQIVWTEKEGTRDAWFVLPDDEQPLIGLESGVGWSGLRIGWHQCVTEPSTLRTSIRTLTDTSERTQLALIKIGGTQVLWSIGEIEGEDQWTAPVVFEFSTSKEDGRLLRWFKLSPVPESLLFELEKYRPRYIPRVDMSVNSLLFGAFRGSQEIDDVKVRVSVDVESKQYRVEFSSGDAREMSNTFELISLLKYPYLKGAPLRTEDDRLLFWDHKKDIEYYTVVDRREESHVIFLSSLRPLIHRVDLFSLSDIVPKTCAELLQTSDGGTITLTAEVDEVRRNSGNFNFITIKLKGLPKKSKLRSLENEWMNPYDLELLVECEGLVDDSIGKEFTLDINVNQLRGVRLPSDVAEDSQLIKSLRVDDEEYEDRVLLLPEGEWLLSSDIKKGMIQWTLKSPLTKQTWTRKTFSTRLNGTLNLEEMIEEYIGELKAVGASRNSIFNYDEELDNIRDALRTYGWGDEKPPGRVEVEKTREKLRITLLTIGENEVIVYEEEFTPIKDDDVESVIDVLDEVALSEYTIENKDEFRKELRGVLDDDELGLDDVDQDEVEMLTFIEEYQEAGMLKAVCTHTNFLVEYYTKQERFDTAMETVDRNIFRLLKMDMEDEDIRWHLFIARVLKAEILMGANYPKDSRKEIEKAFDVISDDIELWKLGVGTRRDFYERGMKLRNDAK